MTDEQKQAPPYKLFTETQQAFSHNLYLEQIVKDPFSYVELIDVINNMTEDDEMKIYFNGYGGEVAAAIQLRNAIKNTRGHVIGVASGNVISAHGMIFLSCHEHIVEPHIKLLAHNYAGGTFGKGFELYREAMFDREWSVELVKDVYTGFLSEEEVERLLRDETLIFTAKETEERCKALVLHQGGVSATSHVEIKEGMFVPFEIYDACIKHNDEALLCNTLNQEEEQ